MKNIKFNVWNNAFHKGGAPCNVKDIQEIKQTNPTKKEEQPCLQVFNTGYRVTSENIVWETWNGCVFIDIDSKHYYETHKFDANKLYDLLLEKLQYDYYEFFYNIHTSWSGNSYHIIFYYDVEKNETNFKKCCQKSREIIVDCFESIGAGEIISSKNVLDSCTVSPYQCLFFNPKKSDYCLSDEQLGKWYDIDNYELEENYIVKVNDVNKDLTSNFEYNGFKEISNDKKEAHHHYRMSIYMSLVSILKEKQLVDEHWKNICEKHIYCPGYSSEKLFNDANKNRWYEKYERYTHVVNIDTLKEFGYNITRSFIPQKLELYKPDVILEIDSNQFLADIDIERHLSTTKINHIFAGCGFGKTYWAKKLSESNRVCFISPLTSISRDSFEDNTNFVIIDGVHKDENKYIFGSINEVINSDKSICTTWESFVTYEMYKTKFDYIIVDEAHTISMYDYRLDSIVQLKMHIKTALSKYTILMTGTPSTEVEEFDCYKLSIVKEQPKVKCDIVAYNDSYYGYILKDIKSWITEDNHYAVVFKDTANHIDEDKFTFDCIDDVFMFNSSYVDNVNELIATKTLKHKVNIISVYGQAGINIHTNDEKKIRLYILNRNGLAAIQYANRIRNKKSIDKVIIPIKKSNISNDVKKINLDVDIKEAEKKVEIINSTRKIFDIFDDNNRQLLKFKYGFTADCFDYVENKVVLNERKYTLYKQINEVDKYEKQTQVLYNRLIDNYFNVDFIYVDKDIKTNKETKNRSNQFSGVMSRFDFSQVVEKESTNMLIVKPNKQLKKVTTGDLIEIIEGLLNILANNNIDYITGFNNIVASVIKDKGSITKSDLKHIYYIIKMNTYWNKYYDNGFVYVMMSESWDNYKITAALVRSMYNDTNKDYWKDIADEMYTKVCVIRKSLGYVKYVESLIDFKFDNPNKLNIENDDITSMIYTYVVNQHIRGKKGGKKGGKKIEFEGKVYNSITEAVEITGKSRSTISRNCTYL